MLFNVKKYLSNKKRLEIKVTFRKNECPDSTKRNKTWIPFSPYAFASSGGFGMSQNKLRWL